MIPSIAVQDASGDNTVTVCKCAARVNTAGCLPSTMCLICLEVGFLLVCNVAHNCYHCTVNGFTCLEAGYGELLLTHLSCLAAPTEIGKGRVQSLLLTSYGNDQSWSTTW